DNGEKYLRNSSSRGYEEFEDCPRETTIIGNWIESMLETAEYIELELKKKEKSVYSYQESCNAMCDNEEAYTNLKSL
ncbi:15640_t:CDS:2, partial [Gigaspora margarita]